MDSVFLNRRLIPARAGTTAYRSPSAARTRAHPRSRGDHKLHIECDLIDEGSSPLARGPHIAYGSAVACVGLIPARAGTTPGTAPAVPERRAHPRSRGDHLHPPKEPHRGWGSSPLARGPPTKKPTHPQAFGLIPARAGTTSALVCAAVLPWAHPRSRGDHFTVS